MANFTIDEAVNKWGQVLDGTDLGPIKESHRKRVTAVMMENSQRELGSLVGYGQHQGLNESAIPVNFMGASSSTAGAGGIDTFDPIMISLLRRTMPNLMAYDIMGVQPMTGPTGLIFALRSRYTNQSGGENFYNEVNGQFTTVVSGANTIGLKQVGTLPGNSTQTVNLASTGLYNFATGMSTAQSEALGTDSNTAFAEMSFTIEKVTATAVARGLRAQYTLELAQDLKAVHGLDVETELSNILTTEIMAEINREMVRSIYVTAKQGCSVGTTTAGIFDCDTDSNGRWSAEKWKGLMYQIERESNKIAKDTRRGRGNIIICSSDVASALEMAGKLTNTPYLNTNGFSPDDTGSTFIGILNGRYKVYIDPYVTGDFFVVGYKGQNPYDAGLFYCPYVPLFQVRAQDPVSYVPSIGFKTRYAVVANPFAEGLTKGGGTLDKDSNLYYRRVLVQNLL